MKFTCIVCGFNELEEPPYEEGDPSFEVCPCCGFQYGFDDLDQGYTFAEYREKWISEGAEWFSRSRKPKLGWSVEEQLKRIL